MIAAGVFDEPDDGNYDFVFGLERVLDGIETLIEKRRNGCADATADVKLRAWERVEQARDELVALSHRIHANPEPRVRGGAGVRLAVRAAGRGRPRGRAGWATCRRRSRPGPGRGPLHVVVCAEYDALPAVGHACGHNVIAAMAAGAGLGLARGRRRRRPARDRARPWPRRAAAARSCCSSGAPSTGPTRP